MDKDDAVTGTTSSCYIITSLPPSCCNTTLHDLLLRPHELTTTTNIQGQPGTAHHVDALRLFPSPEQMELVRRHYLDGAVASRRSQRTANSAADDDDDEVPRCQ
jgi:hypothetical protein